MRILRRTTIGLITASVLPIIAVGAAALLGASPQVLAGVAILGVAATSAVSVALSRRIARPVEATIDGALSIARGQFGIQLALPGKNELGDLAHTFNFMSGQLAQYDADNKELIARLEQGVVQTIIARTIHA